MQRHEVYGISLSTLFLFVLAPPNLSRDHQSEATAASNCSDLGIATSPTSVAGNNPRLSILNSSRKTGDGCEEQLVRLGRYREAVEAYKRMVKVNPQDAVLLNNLCVAYLQLSHYEDGIATCSEALRMDPRLPDAYSNLAMGLSLLGKYRESAEAYRRAIQINPQFAEAHNNLGVAYNRLERYSKAIKAFKPPPTWLLAIARPHWLNTRF
jgi:tetratricopeptide (TPR) repeat protein